MDKHTLETAMCVCNRAQVLLRTIDILSNLLVDDDDSVSWTRRGCSTQLVESGVLRGIIAEGIRTSFKKALDEFEALELPVKAECSNQAQSSVQSTPDYAGG